MRAAKSVIMRGGMYDSSQKASNKTRSGAGQEACIKLRGNINKLLEGK